MFICHVGGDDSESYTLNVETVGEGVREVRMTERKVAKDLSIVIFDDFLLFHMSLFLI